MVKERTLLDKKICALDRAHDLRKFEIELYWKRATYFWAFIASSFVAFFALLGSDKIENKENYLFLVSSIGIVFSLGWYLVNRGSKFWVQNWELIIGQIEDDISGPIMKTTWKAKNKAWELTLSKNYSVTKINQIINLFVSFIWIFIGVVMIIKNLNRYEFDFKGNYFFPINLAFLLVFIFIMFYYGRSGSNKEKGSIENIF